MRAPHALPLLMPLLACGPASSHEDVSHPSQPLVFDEQQPSHPSLVVRVADLPALRAKASRSPWREVAQSALNYARNESFDPLASDFDAKTKMTDLCGALALAYVLDPRPLWVGKFRDTLAHWPAFYLASGDGVQVRWRQAAMTQTILALDVMHEALTPAERTAIEGMLSAMVRGWQNNLDQDGTSSTPGIVALWALYQGQRGLAQEAAELYLQRGFDSLAPSGVYASGPGYAWVRQGGDRLSKYVLEDILEFTGRNTELYADPALRTLHEWMYRGSFTPWRTNLTFGDSDPSRPIEGLLGYVQPYRANHFSAAAGHNAAWVVRDVEPRPLLSSYVLMDDTILAPVPPTSTLWGDTAAFWEQGAGEKSLMGALWSPRSSSSHSHHDVNAVHLCAYGENVLRNAGYCGSGIGIDATFDWNWVFDSTAANNTVTIGGTEHEEKFGGGIVEGLTAPRFDYAAAHSGPALEIGAHTRSLLMIHGEPGRAGYFVLLDEVQTDVPGTDVNVNLHPDSAQSTTNVSGTDYEWSIQHFGANPVQLTLFLATRPLVAQLLAGGLCAFDDNEYVGTYLRSSYLSDAAGQMNAVTLAVPHDANHAKPALTRISGGAQFSGASVALGAGTIDYILESKGVSPVVIGQAFFQGKAFYTRITPGGIGQYFVRQGRGFDDGAAQRTGFDSDAELSLFVRELEARVTSAGTTVVFHDPALGGNAWSSAAGTVLSAGPGFVQVALNPGRHAFDLHTGAELP